MVANQKSQQDIFNELTKANKDKANDGVFAVIKVYDDTNRELFKEWMDELDPTCRISRHDFRMEVIKKSSRAVCKVVLTRECCSDDQLLENPRSTFSDAPTMNQAREELRNMRQREKESVRMYAYRWGIALVRSSGIRPENKAHPHVIKDFISSLEKNIRNKIINKYAELRNPPRIIQEAFNLAIGIKTQIQVADSFQMELSNNLPPMDINKISADEISSDEFEVSEASRGKKWCNGNNYRKSNYNNQNFNNKPRYNSKTQDNKSGKKWE